MNCNEINQHLLGFLSQILTERELREFNEHIASCINCAAKVIAERELEKLIKEKMVKGVSVAPGLNDKIITKIEQTPILKITYCDGQEEFIVVKENLVTFGRGTTNTIVLSSDVKLSREHCRIEYKDGKYEIADLDSTNGIYVNKQKVSRHCLNSGDKILIGQTNIIFELPVVKKAATTEEKVSQSESPSPAPQIINGKKPVLYMKQVNSSNSVIPYVAAAAVILVLIGLFISQPSDNTQRKKTGKQKIIQSYSAEQSDMLQADIYKLDTLVKSLDSQCRYDESLNKYKEFVELHNGELNENQREYLEEKMKSLEQICTKEKEAKEALAQLEKETKAVTDLKSLKSKYDSFYVASSTTSLGPKIKEKIDALDGLAKASPLVTDDLASGDYARAISRYSDISNRCKDLTIQALITKEIDSINNKAKVDFESIIRQGQELITKKDYAKVKDLYLSNVDRFRETNYAVQLNAEISSVDKFILQDTDKMASAKKTSVKIVQEIDNLLAIYNYSEAIREITEALKVTEGYYPEINELLSRRLPDIEKESALFDNCIKTIKGKEVSLPRLGLNGMVSKSAEDGFNISGKFIKWTALMPDEVYMLYKTTGLIFSETEGVTIFCLEHKLMDGAFETLNLLLQKSSKRKPELDNLLARYTGKKVPPEGFIIYKNKWLTPDEKVALINIENATDLANKVKTINKLAELEKNCQEFEQLIKSNPTQASEFKEIIIKALQQKDENLRAVIQKKLATTNLEQLTLLKKELNQKRKEALKEIHEGKPVEAGDKPVLSKEMDEKIRAVKTLWEKPAEKVIEIDKPLNNTAEMLKMVESEMKKYTLVVKDKNKEEDKDKEEKVDKVDKENAEPEGEPDIITVLANNSTIDIKNFPLNKTETKLIEYNQKIMKINEENKVADSIEKEMVKIINEYRIMMGLPAYRLDDRLSRASRKHSQFMEGVKTLAHEGIGDGTPSTRLQAEGFSGGCGENCATGQKTPIGYFTAWYWSYKHHLNMIGSWTLIGGGISGDYATTNFGQ